MAEIIIKIPDLEKHLEKEVTKGIEILARAEIARALMVEKMNKMLSKSKLTEKECIKLGREVNKNIRRRLEEKGLL